jgi:hypothetical protein
MTALMVADVGLFASVRPRMHGQGAPLNEAVVAVLEHVAVRAFVGVYSVVPAEVGPTTEGLDELARDDG